MIIGREVFSSGLHSEVTYNVSIRCSGTEAGSDIQYCGGIQFQPCVGWADAPELVRE